MPLVIADRGASADAPEHTIAAFELALAQGADGIALDVHLTRDGQPVVIHDFTLERTTDGAGAVRAHTTQEVKRLDAGGWRDRRFRGQRVQTLQEVLERFRDRTQFWIEIKGGSDVYPDIEERVVSTLEVYEAVDRTLIQSSDPNGSGHDSHAERGRQTGSGHRRANDRAVPRGPRARPGALLRRWGGREDRRGDSERGARALCQKRGGSRPDRSTRSVGRERHHH